jgi:hypothetical protein
MESDSSSEEDRKTEKKKKKGKKKKEEGKVISERELDELKALKEAKEKGIIINK